MFGKAFWFLAIVYLILVGATVWSLVQTQAWVESTYDTAQEAENWATLREAVEAQKKTENPNRSTSPPPSGAPPIKIWFSDNFAMVITWSILFLTILYWCVGIMLLGALRTSNQIPESSRQDAPQ